MFTNAIANRAQLSYSQLLPNTKPLLFYLFYYFTLGNLLAAKQQLSSNRSPKNPNNILPDLHLSPMISRCIPLSRLRRHAQADTSLDRRPRRFSPCPLGARNFSHWLACSNLVDGEPISYADS